MRVLIEGGIYKKSISSSYGGGSLSFVEGSVHNFAEYMALAPHTIDIEIPYVDTTAIEIDALKSAIKKEKADSSVRVAAFECAINNLLCIENGTTQKVMPVDFSEDGIPF